MQHFQHVIQEIFNYLRLLVCMCLRYCVCARACVCACVFRLVWCLPVWVGETLHDPGMQPWEQAI